MAQGWAPRGQHAGGALHLHGLGKAFVMQALLGGLIIFALRLTDGE